MQESYGDIGNRRGAARTEVSGVLARVNGLDGEFAAKDMSANGVGLDYTENMKAGDPVNLSLYEYGELIAAEVPARVAHSGGQLTGLYFDNLESYQYDAIYSYVLDTQMDEIQNYKYLSPYYI
jgi:hypothetical protein